MSKPTEAVVTEVTQPETAVTTTAPEGSTLAVLERLVQLPNVSADALEKLVALQERVLDRENRVNLDNAMAKIKGDMQEEARKIRKVKSVFHNSIHKYDFAPIQEIQRVLDPVCAKHGVTYRFDEIHQPADNPANDRVIYTMTISGHGAEIKVQRTQYRYSGKAGGKDLMNEVQAGGAATSYARRYLMISGFALVIDDKTQEDTDANNDDKTQVTDRKQTPETTASNDMTKNDWDKINAARAQAAKQLGIDIKKVTTDQNRKWLAVMIKEASAAASQCTGEYTMKEIATHISPPELTQAFYNAFNTLKDQTAQKKRGAK